MERQVTTSGKRHANSKGTLVSKKARRLQKAQQRMLNRPETPSAH